MESLHRDASVPDRNLALELVRVTDALAAAHPGWPRFRVGVNTGPAVVGTIGAAGRHSLATIGDTTNLAARLMAVAEPGQVVVHLLLGAARGQVDRAPQPDRVRDVGEQVLERSGADRAQHRVQVLVGDGGVAAQRSSR